jgi:anti-sigma B factor antagonist
MSNITNPVKGVRWIGSDHQIVVLDAVGDIDLHRSADFQQALVEPLAKHPTVMIVNLAGVPYMDSSGVASLVKLLARVRRDKVALRLAALTPRVRSVFEITRLDTVFDIFATEQEAMKV